MVDRDLNKKQRRNERLAVLIPRLQSACQTDGVRPSQSILCYFFRIVLEDQRSVHTQAVQRLLLCLLSSAVHCVSVLSRPVLPSDQNDCLDCKHLSVAVAVGGLLCDKIKCFTPAVEGNSQRAASGQSSKSKTRIVTREKHFSDLKAVVENKLNKYLIEQTASPHSPWR